MSTLGSENDLENARGHLIYPEQNHPDGAENAEGERIDQNHNQINLRVTIDPAMPPGFSGTLHTWIYDPDNYVSGAKDPNDTTSNEPGDNVAGQNKTLDPAFDIGVPLGDSITFPHGDPDSDPNSDTITVTIDEPQPGNNWIAAVHDNRTLLKNTLQFRDDGYTLYRQVGDSDQDVPGQNHTEMLTVARTLWMEMDQMHAPELTDGPFGADTDDTMFQPYLPEVQPAGADPAATLESIIFPTLVFIDILHADYDSQDNASFVHHLSDDHRVVGQAVRDEGSKASFWVVQSLGSYEAIETKDNDPNGESFFLGWSFHDEGDGPNAIFFETIRDIVNDSSQPEDLNDFPTLHAIVVAHEAFHRFFGWHTPLSEDEGIMDNENAMYKPNDDLNLSDTQFRMIQATENPE